MADALHDNNYITSLIASNTAGTSPIRVTGIVLTDSNPLHVAMVDGNGDQITSFGGGTQYTDGGTPPTHPVGNTLEFNNAGTWATVGSANPLPISGSISATNPSVGTDGSAIPLSSTLLGGSDGTNLQPLQVDASKNLKVILENSSIPVTGTFYQTTQPVSGTFWPTTQPISGSITATQAAGSNLHTVVDSGTITTVSAVTAISNALPAGTNIIGHIIADSGSTTAVTGNVTVIGQATGSVVPSTGLYTAGIAKTSLPTAATDGNLTGMMVDKFGRKVALQGTIRDLRSSQSTTITASTSETTVVTATSNVFNDLVALIFANTSATGTRVDVRNTTAGSVIGSLYIPGNETRGFSIPGESLPQTGANTNWTVTCITSISSLYVWAIFDENK